MVLGRLDQPQWRGDQSHGADGVDDPVRRPVGGGPFSTGLGPQLGPDDLATPRLGVPPP